MTNRMLLLILVFLGLSILHLSKVKNGVKKAYAGIFVLIGIILVALGAYGLFASLLH